MTLATFADFHTHELAWPCNLLELFNKEIGLEYGGLVSFADVGR
jgi:hypothetical protein